jgi:hypothetical protein
MENHFSRRRPPNAYASAQHHGLRPELADLDRVTLGPAIRGTSEHWLLFDAWPMGIIDMGTGAFWPLTLEPDGRFCLAKDSI